MLKSSLVSSTHVQTLQRKQILQIYRWLWNRVWQCDTDYTTPLHGKSKDNENLSTLHRLQHKADTRWVNVETLLITIKPLPFEPVDATKTKHKLPSNECKHTHTYYCSSFLLKAVDLNHMMYVSLGLVCNVQNMRFSRDNVFHSVAWFSKLLIHY